MVHRIGYLRITHLLVILWAASISVVFAELTTTDPGSKYQENEIVYQYDVDSWVLANEIIQELTEGKTLEEIRAMLDTLTAALSEASLCGPASIKALTDAGIPVGQALDSLAKACDITGRQLAELARAITPGVGGDGGPGGPVSP